MPMIEAGSPRLSPSLLLCDSGDLLAHGGGTVMSVGIQSSTAKLLISPCCCASVKKSLDRARLWADGSPDPVAFVTRCVVLDAELVPAAIITDRKSIVWSDFCAFSTGAASLPACV